MKHMKRILAAVLTVTMMLGMVPFTGLAANNYTVDLYWGKLLGVNTDGTPIYAGVGEDGLQNHMWDEVGQDIHAVFLFWNGTEFEEVPVGELTFPTNLNWKISDDYSNAVYMNFDTALKDVITYEKDNVTYSFELEVVDLSLDGPLSYHDACERSTDTWLPMGREGEILYGTHGTPDTAWLMWDTAEVGTVTGVTVYFQDVYGAGVVLNGQSLTDAASALASYNITLTPALDQGYIQVDTDFNRAYNLILTLTNSNGDSYSRHLNIDEKNINIGGTLPDAAFFDEMDRSTDAWLSKEIVQGAAGETRTFWFMWNPDRFTVTQKDDIKVYFERNEEAGIELPATVWNDSVDAFLDDNDYTLELDLNHNCVKITATFDRTVDFYMYLTDKDGNQVEAQLNIDEEEEDDSSVGLYWAKLFGVTNDGTPIYNTDSAAPSMQDIVGEDITAVFLFWNGEAYSEVPYDELDIPDEVTYKQSTEYANAVYMVFENALEDDITYTVDGKTYRFPLKVEAAPELEKGLYWSEFEGLDEEGQPSYSTDANDLDNAMEDVLGQDISAIFLFWTGSEFVEVPADELNIPQDLNYTKNSIHPHALDIVFDKVLNADITYTVDGITYRFNIAVDLPMLGFYTDPVGGETAYVGAELSFDGKDDEGNETDTEIWYLRFRDGRTITSVIVPESFITAEISSDGSYATVTVSEGFVDGDSYRFEVYYEPDEEDDKGFRACKIIINDDRPVGLADGLYWCSVDDPDGVLTPETNNLRNSMNFRAILGNDTWAAFYFVDDGSKTRLMLEDLKWDSLVSFELLEEDKEEQDGFFAVGFKSYGSGYISYEKDGSTYKLPVTIDLAPAAFYSAPERTVESYVGQNLVFDGKDEQGDTVAKETFYLMVEEDWKVTEIVFKESQPEFFTYQIVDNYAVVTIGEGFGSKWYNATVYTESVKDSDNTDWWGLGFKISDQRPGLYWCDVNNPDGILTPETDRMRSSMNFGAVLGNSTWAAFYFVDGENKTQLMLNDLKWDGLVAFELLEENGVEKDGFFRVRFKAYGSGYISYEKDNVTYKLPVTLELPPVAFYSAPKRTEDNCVGQELVFDGQDESGKAVTEETFYLMLEEGWKVTGIEFENGQPDFFSYEIVDNYAVVTIGEDFDDNWYNATVYTESITDANQTDWWGIGLKIRDERPGLKWCWGGSVEDVDNGNYDDLESSMDMNISGSNSSYDIAFYFVDGETVTKLGRDADLDFDDFGKATWNNESSAYDVQFLKFGKHKIVYTDESGAQYSLSVAVTLPDFAFYSEPEASEEAYLSDALILRGDPTTVYLVCRQPWLTITDLELDVWDNDDDMSFLKWTLSPDGSYITMEIGKAVRADHRYSLAVYYQKDNGGTDDYRMSFEVQKKDPGLIWFPAEADGAGGYTVLDKTVHRSSMTMAPGDSILLQLQYFDSANYITPDVDKLTLPDFLEVEVLDAEEAILRVTCKSLGVGAITCTDWSTYSIRVTVQAAGALDFYTQPERSSAYLDRNFNGEDGEVITRYLMWDQTLLPAVDRVTVSLNDGSTGSYVLVDADVTTADLSPWGIVLTPALEQGYVKVEATLSLWRNVKFALWQGSDIGAETVVNIDEDYDEWGDDREGSDNLVFDWNSSAGTVELTIGMGEIEWRGGVAAIGVRGGGYHHFTGEGDMNHQICIGALVNQGTDGEGEAPKAVYDAISNVRFFVSRWMNKDASGDQTKSNISVSEVYTTQFNGKTVYAADLTSEVGGYAYVEVCASFTVTLDGVTRECTVYHRFGTEPKTDFEINMSELDTAEKLNAVLASTEALEAWLQENEPEVLNGFYEALQRGDFANLHLNLPPVKYDGIIEYGITGLEGPDLQGTEDEEGNRTTMPGLWLRGNDSFFLDDIDFVADERYKMTMGEESFTCGILSWGVGTGAAKRGDIFSAQGCTFTGLDYGIRCTPTGYTVMQHNVFIDCGVGYLLDCEGKNGGNANSTLGDNRFVGCDVGVWVRNLPDYITPYDFRVYNNDFINNLVDIDASQHGRLYFYKNYFGYTADGSAPENWEDVSVRHARVRGRGYATVIVNPRWRYAVTLGAPDNYLYLDTWHGLFNYMTAEEAGELTVSAADLDSDLTAAEEPVEINITDQEENDLGTWTFPNGETAAVATYSLRRTVPTDFCAALVFGTDENGNMTVTVQNSSILASRVPTLSVPVDFATAKVLYADEELPDVTVSGGKVIFPVAAGGTYTIIGTDEEADYVPSESVGGSEITDVGAWYDYNESDEGSSTADPSFVQIGTETVKEVVQADPDKDLGEALDQVVETEVITVEAVYKAPEDTTVVVLLVLYDADGKMIAMHQQAATEGVNSITVTCDKKLVTTNAVTVKAFIVAADGTMSPLATVPFSTELTIPKN